MNTERPIAIAITGASGSHYALRLIEQLVGRDRELWIMVSSAGQMVLRMEAGEEIPAAPREAAAWLTRRYQARPGQIRVFGRNDWTAPLASGSSPAAAMVVCPCTTGTLAAIASGQSLNLIDRAADVMLKERRKLILVVRETPFSAIHLKNMLHLAQAGAIVMPANPGFYHQPQSIADIIDFMVARILDHLDIPHDLMARWGEP